MSEPCFGCCQAAIAAKRLAAGRGGLADLVAAAKAGEGAAAVLGGDGEGSLDGVSRSGAGALARASQGRLSVLPSPCCCPTSAALPVVATKM